MDILLSSEKFIKSTTNISDNVAGKFIQPSLRESQEVGLRGILGDCLLARLKELVGTKDDQGRRLIELPEYVAYQDLLDRCQYYLAYSTIVEVVTKVSYKVGNFGVAKSTDEHLVVADADELARNQEYYQTKADSACRELQGWLLDNSAAFPELRDCDCAKIRANLSSAASCGIWLGGPRGKILPGGGGCCR